MDLPTHQNQNENQSKSILNRSLQFKLFDFFFSLSSKIFCALINVMMILALVTRRQAKCGLKRIK